MESNSEYFLTVTVQSRFFPSIGMACHSYTNEMHSQIYAMTTLQFEKEPPVLTA
jgi:hypothetical protein